MSVRYIILAISCVLCMHDAAAQTRIDLEAYKAYREARKGMSLDQLYQEFPTAPFRNGASTDIYTANYFDRINTKYTLTLDERALLERNSFMVTERLDFIDYHTAYLDGYRKDLPVYISSDALLHALHRTYSNVLKDLELSILSRTVSDALHALRAQITAEGHIADPLARAARADVDVYLAVAQALATGSTEAQTFNGAHKGLADEVLVAIYAEQPAKLTTFTQQARSFDFSQMKPRGHYAGDEYLERYFRTMMWLGRTEIYITAPTGVVPPVLPEDVARQCRMAVDLARLMKSSGADTLFGKTEMVLGRLIGEQDNLTTTKLIDIVESLQLTPAVLPDAASCRAFQDAVIAAGGGQQILSQLLTDAGGDDDITPAASYLVMGQRFLFDSFVLANVVFDKVRSLRMMPDPQDVLFVLGNDASAQLLADDITKYQYAENLAALRYLTNSLDTSYWNSSMYASWLQAIRSLHPPRERSSLPLYMQTAAWWQKTMNTQLASWTELRHDNLLYGKQSYTGELGCYYPSGYVEPVPDVYRAIGNAASILKSAIDLVAPEGSPDSFGQIRSMRSCLASFDRVTTLLVSISEKELSAIPVALNDDERELIDSWIMRSPMGAGGCVTTYDGYYPDLCYGVSTQHEGRQPDIVTADVHTQPSDEDGAPVGRVLHVGTGLINTAVVIATDPSDGCATAYVGPVSSYYQYVTKDFERATDQEWAAMLEDTVQPRPSWTRLYLADGNGVRRDVDAPSLLVTSVDDAPSITTGNVGIAPNPTTASTLITLTTASYATNADITIHDAQGALVSVVHRGALDGGTHMFRWDGRSSTGSVLASGAYTVRAVVDGRMTSQTVVLTR